jgi:hypothetical protein
MKTNYFIETQPDKFADAKRYMMKTERKHLTAKKQSSKIKLD